MIENIEDSKIEHSEESENDLNIFEEVNDFPLSDDNDNLGVRIKLKIPPNMMNHIDLNHYDQPTSDYTVFEKTIYA